MIIRLGQNIPLFLFLEDGSSDKYILADIVNPLTGWKIALEVVLSYVPGTIGIYANDDVVMPDVQSLQVVYQVFEADQSTLVRYVGEKIFLEPAAGPTQIFSEEITAYVDDNRLIVTIDG